MVTKNNEGYQLKITITRHGPKEGLGGNLTAEGKQSVLDYYKSLYDGNAIKKFPKRKLVSSPIHRAIETAYIYKGVIEEFDTSAAVPLEKDERLSEKDLVDFILQLPDEKQSDWFRYWYYSASGARAIHEFSHWISEQIYRQKENGGILRIDAFSHGPIMAGFILRIEDILGKELLSPVQSNEKRLDFARLFSARSCAFDYLGSISISVSSQSPEFIEITTQKNTNLIPLSVLNDI